MYRQEPVYLHNLYPQFDDVVRLLAAVLQERGHKVTTTRIIDPSLSTLYILFGVNVWEDAAPLPRRFIVYQLEQSPIRKWFTPAYFARLALASQVWDYNVANIEYLAKRGIDAVHVPLGYMPVLEGGAAGGAASGEPTPGGILFLGQLVNPHRQRQIESLRQAGLPVTARNNAFGAEKHRLVSAAAVVLNLHYGVEALLEEARLLPLLAMGKLVISEPVTDTRYMRLYQDHVIFLRAGESLVDCCRHWLRDDMAPERERRGRTAREWVRTHRVMSKLFPWERVTREPPPPGIRHHQSSRTVAATEHEIMVDRALHLCFPGWLPQRHYGERTLLRRMTEAADAPVSRVPVEPF